MYIGLPHQHPGLGNPNLVGKLKKATYGARDALRYGRVAPACLWHKQKVITIVVHVGGFLCVGRGLSRWSACAIR